MVVVGKNERALTVKRGPAIDGEGAHHLFVVRGARAVKAPVRIGLTGFESCEVGVETAVRRIVRHNDQEVPVAHRMSDSAGAAAEEPDLLGLPLRNDAVQKRVYRMQIDGSTGLVADARSCLGRV